MKIIRLYTDEKGESHFEDMEIPYTESGRAGKLSARLHATGIIFREVAPDYDLDWHPAPRRQFIINLTGAVKITASDGEVRIFGPGSIMLADDTTAALAGPPLRDEGSTSRRDRWPSTGLVPPNTDWSLPMLRAAFHCTPS